MLPYPVYDMDVAAIVMLTLNQIQRGAAVSVSTDGRSEGAVCGGEREIEME